MSEAEVVLVLIDRVGPGVEVQTTTSGVRAEVERLVRERKPESS